MNCVIVYNGVSGSGKSEVIDCIRTFYENTEVNSPKLKFLGLNDISNPNYEGSNKLAIGNVKDYSTVDAYSRLLIKMQEGPSDWANSAEYSELCQHLRSAEARKLLVTLKETFEYTYPGCSNRYVLKLIDQYINKTINIRPELSRVYTLNFFFVSIREPNNIEDFVNTCPYPVRTLYIDRKESEAEPADGFNRKIIEGFNYDYYLSNDGGLSDIPWLVQKFMANTVKDFIENTELNQSDISRAAHEAKDGLSFGHIFDTFEISDRQPRNSFWFPINDDIVPV